MPASVSSSSSSSSLRSGSLLVPPSGLCVLTHGLEKEVEGEAKPMRLTSQAVVDTLTFPAYRRQTPVTLASLRASDPLAPMSDGNVVQLYLRLKIMGELIARRDTLRRQISEMHMEEATALTPHVLVAEASEQRQRLMACLQEEICCSIRIFQLRNSAYAAFEHRWMVPPSRLFKSLWGVLVAADAEQTQAHATHMAALTLSAEIPVQGVSMASAAATPANVAAPVPAVVATAPPAASAVSVSDSSLAAVAVLAGDALDSMLVAGDEAVPLTPAQPTIVNDSVKVSELYTLSSSCQFHCATDTEADDSDDESDARSCCYRYVSDDEDDQLCARTDKVKQESGSTPLDRYQSFAGDALWLPVGHHSPKSKVPLSPLPILLFPAKTRAVAPSGAGQGGNGAGNAGQAGVGGGGAAASSSDEEDASADASSSSRGFSSSSSASNDEEVAAALALSRCPVLMGELIAQKARVCFNCDQPMAAHPRMPSAAVDVPGVSSSSSSSNVPSSSSASTRKMPNASELPKFRSSKALKDPEVYVTELSRLMRFHSLDFDTHFRLCLIMSAGDENIKRWLEAPERIALSADQLRSAFITQYSDHTLLEEVRKELNKREQKVGEEVSVYIGDVQRLAGRLPRFDVHSAALIDKTERGLLDDIRAHLRKAFTDRQRSAADKASFLSSFTGVLPADKLKGVEDELTFISTCKEVSEQFKTLDELCRAAVEAEKCVRLERALAEKRAPPRHLQLAESGDGGVPFTVPPPAAAGSVKLKHPANVPGGPSVKRMGAPVAAKGAAAKGSDKGTKRPQAPPAAMGKTCWTCGRPNHTILDCNKNKDGCVMGMSCTETKPHVLRECPAVKQGKDIPAEAKQYKPADFVSRKKARHRRLNVLSAMACKMMLGGPSDTPLVLSCDQLGEERVPIILDSGAQFSTISKSLCDKHGLVPTLPPMDEPSRIQGAASSMQSARLGTVSLRVVVHFPESDRRQPVSFVKKLEVLEASDDAHVLFGVEVFPTLFPDAWKEIGRYMVPMSCITDRPHHVKLCPPSVSGASPLGEGKEAGGKEEDLEPHLFQLGEVSVSEDILTLSTQVNTFGAGSVPPGEMPSRLSAFTVGERSEEDRALLADLYKKMQPWFWKNQRTEPFCSDKDSVVYLSVGPSNLDKLYRRQYPLPHALTAPIQAILDRWLKEGKIKPAPKGCKFNSPLLGVPKKDEYGKMTGVRLCIDIRTLNQFLLEDDRFQLPRIPDVLATFAGGKLFGEFDLSEAYFQFRLAEESQQYTAFTWNGQQYVFVGCPFGIKHIPSLFQRYIVNLFKDMPFVFPYIDNLGFASSSWDEHYKHASMIVERLNSVNLRIKPSSYNLGNTSMRLLGHVISADGVSIDPDKRQMVLDWPKPMTGSNMASALGLGDFLRDHIRHYADITAPLIEVKSHKTIVWTPLLERHWTLFKRAIATAPLLKFPDFTKRMVLAVDASQTGVGGVLYQPDDDSNVITPRNIIAICSKKLNGTQRNYPVYKKELWGMVYALRKFHGFIWGHRHVTVLTDHKPLIHILKQQVLSVALQQWLDVLLDYDLTIQYRPGVLHVIPDALSRMYESTYGDDTITWGTASNIKLLEGFDSTGATTGSPSDRECIASLEAIKPPSVVKKRHQALAAQPAPPSKRGRSEKGSMPAEQAEPLPSPFTFGEEELEVDVLHELDASMSERNPLTAASDDNTARIAKLSLASVAEVERLDFESIVSAYNRSSEDVPLDVEGPSIRTLATLTVEEKLLLAQEKRGKSVPSVTRQQALLQRAHAAGHFGEHAMRAYIDREGYWWPKMRADIAAVINDCVNCQRHSVTTHGFHPARSIHAELPGDHYMVDLAAFQESLNKETFCLVLVDVCTGFLILRPLQDKKMETVARALWEIFCDFGLPKTLQSDNGTEFSNENLRAITRLIGVPHRFISEYNPRADGKVERAVATIKGMLYKQLNGAGVFWPLHLPFIQLAYNDKVQALTGSTAFALMFGRSANAPVDYTLDVNTLEPFDVAKWQAHQEKMLSLIFPATSKRVDEHQAAYRARLNEVRRRVVHEGLQPGTVVWLKDPKYILNPQARPGHEPKHIGPYMVVRQNKYGAYVLRDGADQLLDRTVPIDQMVVRETARKRAVSGDATSSSPSSSSSSSEEQAVEKVLDVRTDDFSSALSYLVKWKGKPSAQNSWVSESDFVDTAVIDKFYREQSARSIGKRLTQARIRSLAAPSVNLEVLRIVRDRPSR